jgi:hypothetical protein
MAAPASEPTYDVDTRPEKGDDVDRPHDPELQAIEVSLQLLQALPYPTQVRAVTYLKERIESDPDVWGPTDPGPAMVTVTRREVAQMLAKADEYDWDTMTPAAQAPYYQRAEALTTAPFVVERLS